MRQEIIQKFKQGYRIEIALSIDTISDATIIITNAENFIVDIYENFRGIDITPIIASQCLHLFVNNVLNCQLSNDIKVLKENKTVFAIDINILNTSDNIVVSKSYVKYPVNSSTFILESFIALRATFDAAINELV